MGVRVLRSKKKEDENRVVSLSVLDVKRAGGGGDPDRLPGRRAGEEVGVSVRAGV
jgi:hypothetical protein